MMVTALNERQMAVLTFLSAWEGDRRGATSMNIHQGVHAILSDGGRVKGLPNTLSALSRRGLVAWRPGFMHDEYYDRWKITDEGRKVVGGELDGKGLPACVNCGEDLGFGMDDAGTKLWMHLTAQTMVACKNPQGPEEGVV